MTNLKEDDINSVVDYYEEIKHRLELFHVSVESFFTKHPILNKKPFPIIHSLKTRLKDPDGLRDKIKRKHEKGIKITKDNLFSEITDLSGVRVLHLYQDQFKAIHEQILDMIRGGDWAFVEEPQAFTWDPESKIMYDNLEIKNSVRETYYTSVHYIIKPNNNSTNPVCCEIQVRTLFEEIWGEIDHSINYPHETKDVSCREQLRVLSKLVSTGTRLADSIYRTLNDHSKKESDAI
jgi:putative GTP pyrophosphokinase